MWRTALPLALLTPILWPAIGHTNRVILLADPQSSTPTFNLVEHAIVEVLRDDGHEVARLVHRGRQGRVQKLLSQAALLRQAARGHFEQLALDAALKKYNKALTKLDRAVATAEDLRPLKDTLTMLAATHLLLGQDRRARGALERLLVLDPSASPNEDVFNPKMTATFDAVASRVRSNPGLNLPINVDPPGAAVIFDGKLVGMAPVTVPNVRPGRHYVTASLKGHETIGRAFDIKARFRHSISLRLNRVSGDSHLDHSSRVAISSIDDSNLAPEAVEIARSVDADTVLLLAATPSELKLVRYSADGGGRDAHTVPNEVRGINSARQLANALLSSVIRGKLVAASAPTTSQQPATRDNEADNVQVASLGGEPEDARPSAVGGGFFSSHAAKNTALWISYSSAAALAAAGGVFGYLALDANNYYGLTAEDSDGRFVHERTTDQREGVPFKEDGERNALIADIMFGIAVAALTTGVCLHLFWDTDGEVDPETSVESESDSLTWTLGPTFVRVDF